MRMVRNSQLRTLANREPQANLSYCGIDAAPVSCGSGRQACKTSFTLRRGECQTYLTLLNWPVSTSWFGVMSVLNGRVTRQRRVGSTILTTDSKRRPAHIGAD